ncbi:MAG: radical SAM protein [Desulfobacterales bacterium]|nr:radical SAM protein [Desulfobacterales bacterium]
MMKYYPRNILLQWHITERCNLRCSHCYQESYQGKELNFSELLSILEQFREFLKAPCVNGNPPIKGHITVTGGEPFVRKDFPDLLNVFAEHQQEFSFAVLTNGTLIDAAMARHLAELNPRFVQVSIEGSQKTHDLIRGRGNFERTATAVKHLVQAGIRTLISFTAHRGNFREFPQVARLGRRLKVFRVWADRLIPSGSGAELQNQVLSPDETREFFEIMLKERKAAQRTWFGNTEIAMQRALQFLMSNSNPYFCTAGNTLVTIQPDGELYPCRRMPISVGNVLETSLDKLYNHSSLFRKLRNQKQYDPRCQDCSYAKKCRGGLKCLSYAITGDPFKADPGCWHIRNESGDNYEEAEEWLKAS